MLKTELCLINVKILCFQDGDSIQNFQNFIN